MTWLEIRGTTLATARAVAALARMVSDDDLGKPALGSWNVGGLGGHLLRALRTPVRYLEEPEPVGEPLASAAAYFAGYLGWRAEDPESADARVAARGAAELPTTSAVVLEEAFAEAAVALEMIDHMDAGRIVPSLFGPIRLDDYLRTRIFEMSVHGLDLAAALDEDWAPPPAAVAHSLTLLAECSMLIGTGAHLLLELTGRAVPVSVSAIPVIR